MYNPPALIHEARGWKVIQSGSICIHSRLCRRIQVQVLIPRVPSICRKWFKLDPPSGWFGFLMVFGDVRHRHGARNGALDSVHSHHHATCRNRRHISATNRKPAKTLQAEKRVSGQLGSAAACGPVGVTTPGLQLVEPDPGGNTRV